MCVQIERSQGNQNKYVHYASQRVISPYGEDTHALRLTSELVDLRAGYSKRIRRASSSSRSLKLHDMMHIVHHIVEGYRSGHNEAVLKTVWGNPRGFESHSLRQKKAACDSVLLFLFAMRM